MSFKRSVPFVGNRESEPHTKRSKIGHFAEEAQHESLLENKYPARVSGYKSRLSLLKTLVEEATKDPVIAEAEPKIAEAILTLSNAFRNLKNSALLDCESSEAPGPKYSIIQPSGTRSGMPSLPPIRDALLRQAVFMHPACGKPQDASYDRLEILGDAYIELMATKLVWERYPGIPAGRISQIRESLVKNETLAKFTEKYGFDQKASVPPTYPDQPKRWIKTKGDIFEAYVAAVVLSNPQNGYEIAEEWLVGLWSPLLDNLGDQKVELRSKEELAKKIMGKGIKLEYVLERSPIQEKGSGTQVFFIGVYLTGWGWERKHLGSGQGLSKAAAGDEAARVALLNTSLISSIITTKEMIMKGK